MNLKNKYAGQNEGFGLEFWLFALGLPLLIAASSLADEGVTSEHLDPIIFLAANQGANTALQSEKSTEKKNTYIPKILSVASGRQLWKAEITAPVSEKDDKGERELLQTIERLHSVKFEAKKPSAPPAVTAEPTPKTEPAAETTSQKPDEEQLESKLLNKPLTKQTLQMAADLLKRPEQIDNPLELGEILFLSGHLPQAAIAYQEALKRTDPNSTASAKDRSWILLQIGNCLRADDPPTAAKMYRQLISEYPHSQWAGAAKAQDQLTEWYKKDNPKTLIVGNNH